MVRGFFHSIKPDVGKAGAGSNKKPRTSVRGFIGLWAILDYLASLGGHTGEASTTLKKPCGRGPLGLFWLTAFKQA